MHKPKPHIVGLSENELEAWILEHNYEKFRTKQIMHWLYQKGVTKFDDMSNLPSQLRTSLDNHFEIRPLFMCEEQISSDGTRKWLVSFDDIGEQAEIVYIPDRTRATLCISSQIGCTLNCTFCHTGTQPLVRNLRSDEIVRQIMFAKNQMDDWQGTKSFITNIVFMGMGEPLLNYDAVANAVKNILHMNISKKKITISTSGIVPNIDKCATEIGVRLAISLHAVNDELRNEIVPINKKYPLKTLLSSCKNYAAATQNEKITFEYVMLKEVNDSDNDAKTLASLIRGIPSKINIIPFNPWPNSQYQCSTHSRIEQFASIIEKAGYIAPVRTPRGQDIMAACGQLKSASIKNKASKTKRCCA